MKHLFNFLEHSKNDPIQELNSKENIAFFILGAPGVGKSTFINNEIKRKKSVKVFSTDDISLLLTKDHNKYAEGSSRLNLKYLYNFIRSTGGSFVYDTTANYTDYIGLLVNIARESGYKIVFIHLLSDLETSLRQNKQRERNVDTEYILKNYNKQSKNIQILDKMRPDSYYIIYNINGKYTYHKYIGGKLRKRKTDRYI